MKHYQFLLATLLSGLISSCGETGTGSSTKTTTAVMQKFTNKASLDSFVLKNTTIDNTSVFTAAKDQIQKDLEMLGKAQKTQHTLSDKLTLLADEAYSFSELKTDSGAELIIPEGSALSLGSLKVDGNTTIDVRSKGLFGVRHVMLNGGSTGITFTTKTTETSQFALANSYNNVPFPQGSDSLSDTSIASIQSSGVVTYNDTIGLDKKDVLLIKDGKFTAPAIENPLGTIIINGNKTQLITTQEPTADGIVFSFTQEKDGYLAISLDKETHTDASIQSSGKTSIGGTLQILSDKDDIASDNHIILSSAHELQGTFDQVIIPENGAIVYDYKNKNVIYKKNVDQKIEEYRKIAKLESKDKYDLADGFLKYTVDAKHWSGLPDKTVSHLVLNAGNYLPSKNTSLDLTSLKSLGRLTFQASQAGINDFKIKSVLLPVQVLEIISTHEAGQSTTLKFVSDDGQNPFIFKRTTTPSVGFKDAASAPIMISNTGNTTWQVNGANGNIKLENGMYFAHKSGIFTLKELENVSGKVILDGGDAKVKSDSFIQGAQGELIVLHEKDHAPTDYLIMTTSAKLDGKLIVISDEDSDTEYKLLISTNAIEGSLKTTDTTLTYKPKKSAPFIARLNSFISSMMPAQNLENFGLNLTSFMTLNLGYTQNMPQNAQTLPTMTTSLKVGIFDVGAGHFAVSSTNAKNASLSTAHFGLSKQLSYDGFKITPSLKFMKLLGNAKGMDLDLYQGKVMANELSFSQNTLCWGAKADFGSMYIDASYQNVISADKTKVLVNNRDTKNWDTGSASTLQISAGFKSQNLNIQAQMSKSEANYLAYNLEFTVKE